MPALQLLTLPAQISVSCASWECQRISSHGRLEPVFAWKSHWDWLFLVNFLTGCRQQALSQGWPAYYYHYRWIALRGFASYHHQRRQRNQMGRGEAVSDFVKEELWDF